MPCLLYRHTVRGPMVIPKEIENKEIPDEDIKITYQCLQDLRTQLEKTCKIALQNLEKASKHQQKYYNKKKRKNRQTKEGDKVLDLLQTKSNKLLMQCKGSYSVIQFPISQV